MPTSPLTPYAGPERRRARARLAALTKSRPAGDPAIAAARRDLATIRTRGLLEAALAELALITTEDSQ
ncbi:hypothetical protein [Streptomyces atratus]|uniref:hypothetical protein n=1 Tax=Streptomyces atratus TaxID=1893 RepID=UPI002F9189AF